MPRRRTLLLAALAVALVATGCRHDGDDAASGASPRPGTGATEARETQEAAPTTEAPETDDAGDARPGAVLERFVEAARGEDAETMWALLSAQSQERLGPTVVRFESGAGRQLRQELARFERGRSAVFLEERITSTFAVAGFGGRIRQGRERPHAAYAAALRRQPEGWRLELGGPVELAPVAPDPGSTVTSRVRLAAEVRSDERVVEAGLWLDGRSVPGRLALTGPSGASMFTNDAPPLVAGPHAVVAFAGTRTEASATAWVFARGSE